MRHACLPCQVKSGASQRRPRYTARHAYPPSSVRAHGVRTVSLLRLGPGRSSAYCICIAPRVVSAHLITRRSPERERKRLRREGAALTRARVARRKERHLWRDGRCSQALAGDGVKTQTPGLRASAFVLTGGSVAFATVSITSGDRTRTCDLEVMSLASCQLLHPASEVDDCSTGPQSCQTPGKRNVVLRFSSRRASPASPR